MTNREMLNSMSDEELAGFLLRNKANCDLCAFAFSSKRNLCLDNLCIQGVMCWLEQEVEEDGKNGSR